MNKANALHAALASKKAVISAIAGGGGGSCISPLPRLHEDLFVFIGRYATLVPLAMPAVTEKSTVEHEMPNRGVADGPLAM